MLEKGKLVRREDFNKMMSLQEFCHRFEGKWTRDKDNNENVLSLTARREVCHYLVRVVPHLTSARANPNSNEHWLYCKHICLWLIPCSTISELFPESSLEGKELQ